MMRMPGFRCAFNASSRSAMPEMAVSAAIKVAVDGPFVLTCSQRLGSCGRNMFGQRTRF